MAKGVCERVKGVCERVGLWVYARQQIRGKELSETVFLAFFCGSHIILGREVCCTVGWLCRTYVCEYAGDYFNVAVSVLQHTGLFETVLCSRDGRGKSYITGV